jgi:hypothetical protein
LRQQKRHDDQIVEIKGVAEDCRPGHETAFAAGIGELDGGQSVSPRKNLAKDFWRKIFAEV